MAVAGQLGMSCVRLDEGAAAALQLDHALSIQHGIRADDRIAVHTQILRQLPHGGQTRARSKGADGDLMFYRIDNLAIDRDGIVAVYLNRH
jgi:hypothetical protein